ncbi:cyclin-D1-binding protein 1 isoform X5 [Paroedura picta]|uniref:cyclin-D1-binding protein 1 isoform X5 n=1 Tax=Paroedura picta TaxID=143630 RepID=UPI004055C1A0
MTLVLVPQELEASRRPRRPRPCSPGCEWCGTRCGSWSSVDELVLSLYPPINQLTLRLNVSWQAGCGAEEAAGGRLGPPRWRSLRGGLGALPLRICGSQHGQNQGPDSRGALIWGLGSWLPALMRKDPDAFPRGWGARNGCLGGAWVSRLWLALGQVAQVIKNCCSYGGLSCVV